MEETWEFAALDMSPYASSLMYQQNLPEEKPLVENSDWTPRHVRLKFQMITSCFLLYLLTGTEIQEISLFGTIKYGDKFPQDKFFGFLLLFSIFTILAFAFRTFFERSRWSSLRKDIADRIDNMRLNEKALTELFDAKRSVEFSKKISVLVSEPNDEYDEEFNSLFSNLKHEQKGGKLRQMHHKFTQIQHDFDQLKRGLECIRPGSHPPLTDYSYSILKISNAVSSIDNSLENVERELESLDRNSSNRHKGIQRNLLRYKDAILDLARTLPELEPKSKILMHLEARRKGLYFFYNYGLSVLVPLYSAGLLVAVSIYLQIN